MSTSRASSPVTPTMAVDVSGNAYTLLKVKPVNSTLLGFGSSPVSAATTSVMPRHYLGYPGEFGETGAVKCENALGARIERKS